MHSRPAYNNKSTFTRFDEEVRYDYGMYEGNRSYYSKDQNRPYFTGQDRRDKRVDVDYFNRYNDEAKWTYTKTGDMYEDWHNRYSDRYELDSYRDDRYDRDRYDRDRYDRDRYERDRYKRHHDDVSRSSGEYSPISKRSRSSSDDRGSSRKKSVVRMNWADMSSDTSSPTPTR